MGVLGLTALSDEQVYYLGSELVALLLGAYAVIFLVTRLRRSRPGLQIGYAIAAAFALRLLAAVALELTSVASQLRGGDETTFLSKAGVLADFHGIGSEPSTDALTAELHTFVFSLVKRLIDPAPPFLLRILVIAVAVAGIALLAAGVWELAGPRAATIAAWIVALEPAHVFFSGILHKEPFMFLAEGLLVLGGARVWKRGELIALVPLVLGCLIAIATRPYVGWFFVAAAAAVVLHAFALRRRADRSLVLAAAAVLLAAAFVPVAWEKSSSDKLSELQASQDANASDRTANLSLEQVNYSTRGDVILNLPKRMRDVILRPYPWQQENTSQRLGVLGTMVMLVGLALLLSALVRNRSAVMQRAGPLVYPALFALIAYSLSAGNAGTAFRYRTHVVALLLCLLVVLRAQRAEAPAGQRRAPRMPRLDVLPGTGSPGSRASLYLAVMGRLEQEGPDLRDLLDVLRRRGWILLLCLLAIPAGTYFYSDQLDDVYESSVLIAARPTASDAASLANADLAGPSEQTDAATARLALTSAVGDEAARRLDRAPGTVGLARTSVDEDTGFITLTAEGGTAREAAAVANAFAEALGITRERRAERRVQEALADLRQERAEERDPERAELLLNEIRRLKALETAQQQIVQIIEPAAFGVHVSPNVERNTILGGVLALLIGIGLMGTAERLDRRIRRPEDLQEIAGVPLLTTVPRGAFPDREPAGAHAEAFTALRDSLMYFNVDKAVTSILVVSPLKGDGKTTVATNLALSLARAQRRVILVDADLRHPQVATRLGIPGTPGLSEAILGRPLAEVLRVPDTEVGDRLRVLPAGTPPPNPSELLGSGQMSSLLSRLGEVADVVVIDTPPVLMVSDALPLFDQVAGVVAIANLERTPRDAVRRMLDLITSAHHSARLLGVVATGARRPDRYGAGYGTYAAAPGTPATWEDAARDVGAAPSEQGERRLG